MKETCYSKLSTCKDKCGQCAYNYDTFCLHCYHDYRPWAIALGVVAFVFVVNLCLLAIRSLYQLRKVTKQQSSSSDVQPA